MMTWRPRRQDQFRLDAASLGGLYRRHAEDFVAFCLRRVGVPSDALDLTAETFARAFETRRRFRGTTEQEALGWLFGIARNLVLQYNRDEGIDLRAVRKLRLERPEFTDLEIERLEQSDGDERLRDVLAAALESLPAPQRRAVVLRVVDERTYEQIAEELGVSEQTARARVSRGLRTMGSHVAEDGSAI